MNPPTYSVRRATLDDLPALSELWNTMRLPAEELGKRITEFQVTQSADGKLLGAAGFQLNGRSAQIHGEVFSDFGLADQLRPLLWQRLQAVALNHGIARIWTRESAPFWRQNGFQPADADTMKKLPEAWSRDNSNWLTLKLKDEDAIASFEKEIAMMMQAEKQRTASAIERARVIKIIATILAVALAIFVGVAIVYLLRRNPELLAPH